MSLKGLSQLIEKPQQKSLQTYHGVFLGLLPIFELVSYVLHILLIAQVISGLLDLIKY